MILYTTDTSVLGAKVAIVMTAKSVEAGMREPPGGIGSDEYREIVPSGGVPALVDGDLILSESDVIAEYLEETCPEPALLPGDAKTRARVRFLSRFHDLYVEPPVRTLFRHMDPRIQDMDLVLPALEQLHQSLAQLSTLAKPKPYLATKSLSLADCGFPATLMQADLILEAMGMQSKPTKKLAKWREVLEAHPAVASVMSVCRPASRALLEGKLNVVG